LDIAYEGDEVDLVIGMRTSGFERSSSSASPNTFQSSAIDAEEGTGQRERFRLSESQLAR